MTYTKCRDCFIPNLTIPCTTRPLGRYGQLRKEFLEENDPFLWTELLLDGKLYEHCLEIEEAALNCMDLLVPQLAKAAGVNAELKKRDSMQWVGLMNNCKMQAEEMVFNQIIYK